jgi:membrane associated rhomboid family serine protease
MIQAPVGFQCPECVKGAPAVRTYRDVRRARAAQGTVVTSAIIAVNAVVFLIGISGGSGLARGANRLTAEYALNGFAVDELDQWYRLITAGFLHYGLFHVGFNMLILFQLGQLLEPAFGRVRYGLLYLAALLGGSVGALLVSPEAFTAGASGAVFGLMGAAAVALQRRGINVLQTSIGSLLVVNLLITFAIPGISIGGHVGGLLAGALGGLLLVQTEDNPRAGAVVVGALAAALFGLGIVVA